MSTHILVVDDEPDLEVLIRQKFRRRVRRGELAFSFAHDGVEALEQIAKTPELDIVLTDINMPRMDGLTLLGKIGELDRMLKVVIVSAYGDMDNIRVAMNRGAFDFLTKPINFEDLEVTVEKTRQEVALLKQAIELEAELSHIQRELDIASQIQLSSLPSTFPAFPGRTDFDLHAVMRPALEVGGDFYDFFLIDEDRLGFVVGDVSGKGIAAAIIMAITRTLVRATALQDVSVEDCVRHVNRVLYPEIVRGMFITLVYGILDTRTGEVTYCNAGHNPPYVVQRGGPTEELMRTGGLAVCLLPDFAFGAGRTTLQPGDSLVLYSDGVTEAANKERHLFSEERLINCLNQVNGQAPDGVTRHVLQALEAYADGADQADDITLLTLQYRGRQ